MNTLNEFKKQQSKEIEIICDLLNFLEMGENLGVEIDKRLKEKLLKAINEVKTEKLRVALIGGFSEGKTSIAAAWLEKLDESTMKISHQESSDEVVVYDVGNDIEIVDTLGLFGFKEKNINKYLRITLIILFFMIIASTLLVKQHVIADVIGAFVISIFTAFIFPKLKGRLS